MRTLYLLSYSFFMVFVLFNFFLAIIVDAYARVTSSIEDNEAENSIIADIIDVVRGIIFRLWLGGPTPTSILEQILLNSDLHFDMLDQDGVLENCMRLDNGKVVTADELRSSDLGLTLAQAEQLLASYASKHPPCRRTVAGSPSASDASVVPSTSSIPVSDNNAPPSTEHKPQQLASLGLPKALSIQPQPALLSSADEQVGIPARHHPAAQSGEGELSPLVGVVSFTISQMNSADMLAVARLVRAELDKRGMQHAGVQECTDTRAVQETADIEDRTEESSRSFLQVDSRELQTSR